MAAVGAPASAAAVLRAVQKDESFLQHLLSVIGDITHRTLGASIWMRHHNNITLLTELVYDILTTISLRQTLGEEYTGLLQVNRGLSGLPALMARLASVLLRCCFPQLFSYGLKLCHQSLQSGLLGRRLPPSYVSLLLNNINTIRHAAKLIEHTHLAVFYIRGVFYHLSKRITGIKYVALRRWLLAEKSEDSLKLLGRLLLLQLMLHLFLVIYRRRKSPSPSDSLSEASTYPEVVVPPHMQCTLCLCARQQPTLSTCGHVFCWTCIHSALRSSGHHCPLCRYPVEPRQLVPLVNFK